MPLMVQNLIQLSNEIAKFAKLNDIQFKNKGCAFDGGKDDDDRLLTDRL